MVGDDPKDLAWALNQARYVARLVFISGGLGPTPDDCTRQVISRHFAAPLMPDEDVLNNIIDYFISREKPMPAWIENQALVPKGAVKLTNALGTAPGLWIKRRGSHYFFFPGVPAELQAVFEADVTRLLKDILPTRVEFKALIRTTGISEAKLWEAIDPYTRKPKLELSFLPGFGGVDLLMRGEIAESFEAAVKGIKQVVGPYIYATEERELKEVVGEMLRAEKKTIAVVESCTGGLLARLFTDVPGSSEYFLGGVVAYSNEVKIREVGVKKESIEQHGAVSAETALAMAEGIRERFVSDLGVAVTGVAGPGGGTEEKPVGLVHIALAGQRTRHGEHHRFAGDRERIREQAAAAALDLVRRYLSGILK
jgi:nicotinamide-nucleotide amidase